MNQAHSLDKRILDEDEYLAGLSEIIERDYFPDKKKLIALKELFDAEELGDPLLIQIAKDNLQNIESFDIKTPVTNDTSLKISLNEYLKNYTSEDNVSFEKIQLEYHKKIREKYW